MRFSMNAVIVAGFAVALCLLPAVAKAQPQSDVGINFYNSDNESVDSTGNSGTTSASAQLQYTSQDSGSGSVANGVIKVYSTVTNSAGAPASTGTYGTTTAYFDDTLYASGSSTAVQSVASVVLYATVNDTLTGQANGAIEFDAQGKSGYGNVTDITTSGQQVLALPLNSTDVSNLFSAGGDFYFLYVGATATYDTTYNSAEQEYLMANDVGTSTADFTDPLSLSAIDFYDSNGNFVNGITVTSASGFNYAVNVPTPEPTSAALLALGALTLRRPRNIPAKQSTPGMGN